MMVVVVIFASSSAIAEDNMDAIVPEINFVAAPVIPWWDLKATHGAEPPRHITDSWPKDASRLNGPDPRERRDVPRIHQTETEVTEDAEVEANTKSKSKKLRPTLQSLKAQVTKKVVSSDGCGASECTDKYTRKIKVWVRKKVTNLCAYHKSFGRCRKNNSYYRRRCKKTCTGAGTDQLKLSPRRRHPYMGYVPVRKVYKDKCAWWKSRSSRSCRSGTWLSRRCPKTCHGKGSRGKDEKGKQYVYYASKILKRTPYCQYIKAKGRCNARKGSWQWRNNLTRCQKTCNMCSEGGCHDRYPARPYKRNTYVYKTYKNRCAWVKANKYCKRSKWYRSGYYTHRCKKTCTGSGKDHYSSTRSYKTTVRVRKEWPSRCAFYKAHSSTTCKRSRWVRKNCSKTCLGKGLDKWTVPYRTNRPKIKHTKTYNGYCQWRKSRGDCKKHSWMRRSCSKTCGFCKANAPCEKYDGSFKTLKQVRKQQAGYRKRWDKVNSSAANKATYEKQIKAQDKLNIKAEKARQAWLKSKELGKKRAAAFEPPEPPPSGHYQGGSGSGSGHWVKGWMDPSLKNKPGKEGATSIDQKVTKDGHLMLGGNRRRIGSGFTPSRRRRSKIPGVWKQKGIPKKVLKQAVKGKSILKSLLPKKKGGLTQKERKALLKSGAGLNPKVDSDGHFTKATVKAIKKATLSASNLKKKTAAAKAAALAAAAKLAKIEKDKKKAAKLIGDRAAAAVKAKMAAAKKEKASKAKKEKDKEKALKVKVEKDTKKLAADRKKAAAEKKIKADKAQKEKDSKALAAEKAAKVKKEMDSKAAKAKELLKKEKATKKAKKVAAEKAKKAKVGNVERKAKAEKAAKKSAELNKKKNAERAKKVKAEKEAAEKKKKAEKSTKAAVEISKKEEAKKQKALAAKKAAKKAKEAAKKASAKKAKEKKAKAKEIAKKAKEKSDKEAALRKKAEEITKKAAEKSNKAAKAAAKKEAAKKEVTSKAAKEKAKKKATAATAEKSTKKSEAKAKAKAREAKEKAYCKVAVYNDNNFSGMTWSKQICKSGERYNLTYNQKKGQHSVSLKGPGCSWMRLGDDDSWGRQDVNVYPPGVKNLPYDLESDIKDIQVYLKNEGMKGC